jgi:NADPH:quinone reductase-like Zn-dependent oxidoreductase
MKTIVQDKYGSPDVLELQDIDKPVVKDDEVLVRVHTASVHAGDSLMMRGLPYIARPAIGLLKPKNKVPGTDVAGQVEAVGKNVTQFQPGDEVFGWCTGAFAEYVSVSEDALALKPTNLTFEQAAAVPTSAFTALQGLRDKGEVQPGQKVLIIGASGGVGTFTVQIAKSYGAEVTGVCSTPNVDMVRSIGADHIIDYTQEDITHNGQRYDPILDIAGNRSLSHLRRALTPKGTLVIVGATGGPWLNGIGRTFRALVLSPFVRQRLRGFVSMRKKEDLLVLKELLEAGKVTPVIDRTYGLSEVPEALRYFGEGHTQGKVVITVAAAD